MVVGEPSLAKKQTESAEPPLQPLIPVEHAVNGTGFELHSPHFCEYNAWFSPVQLGSLCEPRADTADSSDRLASATAYLQDSISIFIHESL